MSRKVFIAALALLALFSCGSALQRIQVDIKGVAFDVEVARTEEEREKGLMFRRTLGNRQGMLFVFDRDQHLAFWMKNTRIPLSIAFLSSEGKILEIRDMDPFSLIIVRSRFSSRYALELPRGAFAEIGAATGDDVSFPPGFK
jgi:uncharacterized membrane protein (UPF0127 family)